MQQSCVVPFLWSLNTSGVPNESGNVGSDGIYSHYMYVGQYGNADGGYAARIVWDVSMTALDRTLAKTFRAARWVESGGKPVCAKCFDADDVRAGYASVEARGELNRYFCACCKYHFGDATGTPLAHTSRPLALWAFVTLGGTWEELSLAGADNKWKRDDLREMAKRVRGSIVLGYWVEELCRAKVTVRTLAAALKRRAAGMGGPRRAA